MANMMMTLLDIVLILVINLFVVKFISGDQGFDSYYYYYSISRSSISILPANVNYEVKSSAGYFATKTGKSVIKSNPDQTSAEVNCQFFISFNNQDEGIYTCQDNDGEYYLIPSARIDHDWSPMYYGWTVTCDYVFADITEGEEIEISCKVQPKPDSTYYTAGRVTVGWIQGHHNITQSYDLIRETTRTFDQKFVGFSPGQGLFFYCIEIETRIRCYTLLINVLPFLQVEIKSFYEFFENDRTRCYKCMATGGTSKKVYNWSFNGLQLKSDNEPEICLTNLTAGNYTVECLVSTNAQKTSDVIEFTVRIKEDKNRFKTIVVILTVITIILVLVVFILGYILIRNRNNDLQKLTCGQRSGVSRTSEVSQVDEGDEVYHTIGNPSAETTENDYVENSTQSHADKICNRRDGETPQYFVLES